MGSLLLSIEGFGWVNRTWIHRAAGTRRIRWIRFIVARDDGENGAPSWSIGIVAPVTLGDSVEGDVCRPVAVGANVVAAEPCLDVKRNGKRCRPNVCRDGPAGMKLVICTKLPKTLRSRVGCPRARWSCAVDLPLRAAASGQQMREQYEEGKVLFHGRCVKSPNKNSTKVRKKRRKLALPASVRKIFPRGGFSEREA